MARTARALALLLAASTLALAAPACGDDAPADGDTSTPTDDVAADPGGADGVADPGTADPGPPDEGPQGPDVVGPGLGIDYDADGPGATPRFEPASGDWAATGWPSDRFRREDGTVDLSSFPNPGDIDLLEQYRAFGEEVLDGFGLTGAIYLELDGTVDLASLGTPTDALAPDAVLQLVNVTQGSPAYGKQHPLTVRWYEGGSDLYYSPRTLALRPLFGAGLAEGQTYCAILTRQARDADGRHLQQAPGFLEALVGEPWLAPLAAWLPDSPLGGADIAVATCFTTHHPTAELRKVSEFLADSHPTAIDDVFQPTFWGEFHGLYTAPNFQSGDKPYEFEGGDIKFDADGQPIVQDQEQLRYLMLVPRDQAMPAAGWPVVIYAHGTGGDYESCRGTGYDLNALGYAVLCYDQPLHGPRSGSPLTENEIVLLSFNFLNGRAGRTMFRQAAIDTLTMSRMIVAGAFDLPGEVTLSGDEVRLDPEGVYFFGHSHGGLSGALTMAVDPVIKGGVLSGAAGIFIETILRRKDPADIGALVSLLTGVQREQFDTFHPVLTLVQMLVDATDPIAYAPYWLSPPEGVPPKHVFITEGTEDHASPSVGTDAMAAAAGIPLMLPLAKSSETHDALGLQTVTRPVSLNAGPTDAPRTAALKQWQGGSHWVAFWEPEAEVLWRRFFETMRDGAPVLDTPAASVALGAAASAGDTCASAGVVDPAALPARVAGDTSTAADDYATAGCGDLDEGAGFRDVAFTFTPDVDGRYRFSRGLVSPVDPDDDKVTKAGPTVTYVVTDCGDVAGSCVGGTTSGSLDLELTADTTYHVILDGRAVGDRGAFELTVSRLCAHEACGDRVCGMAGCTDCGACDAGLDCSADGQCLAPPVGDTCADPIEVGDLPWSDSRDSSPYLGDYGYGAGECPGESNGYGAGSDDVAYRFTAPAAATYRADLDGDFDTNLYVVTDCADVAGSCVVADRRWVTDERVVFDLASGETVYVIVDGAANTVNRRGPYTLRIGECVPQCEGKACGDDGCGGTCGTCAPGTLCFDEPECEPFPDICSGHATCEVIPEGGWCGSATEIASVPFSTSGDTDGLMDVTRWGSGVCPGDGGAWGGGLEDATYRFAPAEAGLYRFTVGSAKDAAVYVVEDCDDVDATCLAAKWAQGDKGKRSAWADLAAGQAVYAIVEASAAYTLEVDSCTPSCEGKTCGGDGCNGSCGSCELGQACNGQQCVVRPGWACESAIGVNPDKLPWEHKNGTAGYQPTYASTCADVASGQVSNDIAYTFTPKVAGWYTISLSAGYEAMLYVVADCADLAGGSCLADTQGVAGGQDRVDLELAADVPIWIVVDGDAVEPDTAGGLFTLRVAETCFPDCDGKQCGPDGCGGDCGPCAAPNDYCLADFSCGAPEDVAGSTCAAPFEVGALPFAGAGDTREARNHYGFSDDDCAGWVGKGLGSSDQAWRFAAPAAGDYRVAVVPDGWDATVYAVGSCADVAGTCRGAADGQTVDALTLTLAAGEELLLIVDGVPNDVNEAGKYQITVEAAP